MQKACCEGVKDTTEPKGTFKTLPDGKKFYQTDDKRGKVVILITDVFGIKNINNPLVIADKIHENTGFTVIVPDLFDGKEMADFLDDGNKAQRDASFFFKLRVGAYQMGCLMSFIFKNSQAESLKIVHEHIASLKGEGVTSIGVLGYCWGGKVVLETCADGASDEIVKCGVACHPGAMALGNLHFPDAFKKQSKPMLYCIPEKDQEIGPKQLAQIREICAENSKGKAEDYQKVLYYPGTLHGFAVRGEESNAVVAAARQDALEKQFEFFKKHL